MGWIAYDCYPKNMLALNPSIDHDDNSTTTIKIALVTSSYSPNRATDQYWGTVDGYEVSGDNYTAGGNEVVNKTVTVASNTVKFDADEPATWAQSPSGFSNARYAILYKDTGNPATSPLMAYYDFGSDKENIYGDLTLQLDSAGIATLGSA